MMRTCLPRSQVCVCVLHLCVSGVCARVCLCVCMFVCLYVCMCACMFVRMRTMCMCALLLCVSYSVFEIFSVQSLSHPHHLHFVLLCVYGSCVWIWLAHCLLLSSPHAHHASNPYPPTHALQHTLHKVLSFLCTFPFKLWPIPAYLGAARCSFVHTLMPVESHWLFSLIRSF